MNFKTGHMAFTVQNAQTQDAEEIANLLRRSIIELCGPDHRGDPDLYGSWIANKTAENIADWIAGLGAFLAAKSEAGSVWGVGMADCSGHIVLNYVLPEARGRGVSKALMAALETFVHSRGISEVRLKSTCTAERFYWSIGYVETSKPDVRKGMTFKRFVKVL